MLGMSLHSLIRKVSEANHVPSSTRPLPDADIPIAQWFLRQEVTMEDVCLPWANCPEIEQSLLCGAARPGKMTLDSDYTCFCRQIERQASLFVLVTQSLPVFRATSILPVCIVPKPPQCPF